MTGARAAHPKGWFPDPWGSPDERWWDGSQWTSSTRTPRSARPPLWTSQKVLLVLLVVALVAVGIGGFQLGRSAFATLGAEAVDVPAVITRELDAGRYTLYERIGTTGSVGPITYSDSTGGVLRPGDVTVTGPDGSPVEVGQRDISETLTKGNAIYADLVGFRVERPGTYTVEVTGPDSQVVLGRTLFDGTAGALITLGAGAVLGGISATALFVLMLVRSSRRRAGR